MPQGRQLGSYRVDSFPQVARDEEGEEVGVVEQVEKLVLDVAVVDVDGHGAGLEAPEHDLDPLGAVPRLDADMVTGADTSLDQMVGDAVGALVELGVGATGLAGDQRVAVGHRVDDDLEEVGEVERLQARALRR